MLSDEEFDAQRKERNDKFKEISDATDKIEKSITDRYNENRIINIAKTRGYRIVETFNGQYVVEKQFNYIFWKSWSAVHIVDDRETGMLFLKVIALKPV